ncbi:hypothetical protein N4G41_15005 [Kosakonia sacchari]|uniref:hypothetical protein n=1 Tax=Kosakonia sacchari TaxID=1158459 RepID=UPI002ACE652C|nr:hypothetical protein [Kosakonia sacchari]MDZ7322941.1 hypothetical protein [Kosakonia sacchari]
MWHQKKLTLSGDAGAIICSVLAVHPWTPGAGKQESSGVYLSPENAIEWAAKKLAGAPSTLDVTAILFTAPTLSAFVSVLATAAEIFPVTQLTQVWRRANSALSLSETRLQLPAVAGGLPAVAALSVPTLRQAGTAQTLLSAAGIALPDLGEALAAFKIQRASLLADAGKQLQQLTGTSLDVRAISAVRNTTGAVREMRDEIPSPDHVFTLCLVFAGEDLSALREMLKDE